MDVEKKADDAPDGTKLEILTDREILITRSFDAPARIVFEAVTRPEHIRRWWAPKSRGELLVCEVDLRIGGAWRLVMRTKNGMEVGFSGKFLELEAPTRIVQTEVFDPFPDVVSMVTVTLAEVRGKTTLSNHVVYPSKEVRDQVLASGMEHGMRESYRQLADVVVALAG